MKHLCKNFINKQGICEKCNKPEWADFFENPFKVGDMIRLPIHYTNGGELFKISKKLKDGDYQIEDAQHNPMESFEWWELRPTKKLTLREHNKN